MYLSRGLMVIIPPSTAGTYKVKITHSQHRWGYFRVKRHTRLLLAKLYGLQANVAKRIIHTKLGLL
jgi:hypothetical protein